MTEVLRGLIVDVYRCARWSREGYDPTNNGPSGRLEAFTVVALTRDGEELEPLPRDLPGVYARLRQAARRVGARRVQRLPARAGPARHFRVGSGRWRMAGGNMVDTSDSRWRELVSSFLPSSARLYVSAVEVHDRVETSEQARRLSI